MNTVEAIFKTEHQKFFFVFAFTQQNETLYSETLQLRAAGSVLCPLSSIEL